MILAIGAIVGLLEFAPKRVWHASGEAPAIPSMSARPAVTRFQSGGSATYSVVTVEHEGHRFVVLSGRSEHLLHHPDCEKRDAQTGP